MQFDQNGLSCSREAAAGMNWTLSHLLWYSYYSSNLMLMLSADDKNHKILYNVFFYHKILYNVFWKLRLLLLLVYRLRFSDTSGDLWKIIYSFQKNQSLYVPSWAFPKRPSRKGDNIMMIHFAQLSWFTPIWIPRTRRRASIWLTCGAEDQPCRARVTEGTRRRPSWIAQNAY